MAEVRIGADPVEALVDEKVWITVDGLSPNEPVTIKASVEEEKKRFSSYGCYTSTGRGQVELGTQPSLHGTYTGPGPFCGVIDMFGSGGGLYEHRAALLASRGFCVLSLAFLAYEDLPTIPADITVDYFLEATEWFSGLPRLRSTGIGVLGLSKSGEFALEMARHMSAVKAVVLVNAVTFYSDAPLKFSKGDIPCTECHFDGIVPTPNGMDLTKSQKPSDDFFIKAWESNATVLCIVGEDDHCLNPQLTDRFVKLVPKEHKHRYHIIKYPGAGHLIEPPFAPHCVASFHKHYGHTLNWGGESKEHSYAQEDSWRRILQFFKTQLVFDNFVQEKCKL